MAYPLAHLHEVLENILGIGLLRPNVTRTHSTEQVAAQHTHHSHQHMGWSKQGNQGVNLKLRKRVLCKARSLDSPYTRAIMTVRVA